MYKSIAILFLVFASSLTQAQEKLVTRTGTISFSSKTPIENIEATSNQAASILNIEKKLIAFNVLLKSFKFEKALMEEHFNEKYVHSDKYPSAKFQGTFETDIDLNSPQVYEDVNINGIMLFHGKKQPTSVKATIEVMKDKTLKVTSDFKLVLETYDIEIPSLVKDKIAADIDVNLVANYK